MYDKQPNRDNEIHLDATTRKQLYDTYVKDLEGDEIVSYSSFCTIWKKIFPHVKIPARKAVHGKCTTCAQLTELMRSCTMRDKNYYRGLFTYHAATFMSERRQYYQRRIQAKTEPLEYLSMIMDGMAQVILNDLFIKCIFMRS